uniref:PDZ domain-containing protein n=1 Tax=Setaria digitata TaxID=48799 RepID=A0A915PDS7_9BILA
MCQIYKSKGQIHIGDQILALNQNILNPLLSAGKNYTAFGTSTAYCKQNNVLNQELNTTTLVNSYDAKCCHLAEEEGSGNIKEQQRKKSNSSASNCAKFTEATRNRRLKQSVAGATAEARSITSTRTDDDDNDGREASKRNVTLESDAKISCSSISSALLIDRYEKLIEEFHDSKSIHEESENCSASVIVVTLLRQSPHMVLTSDWTEIQIIHLPNIPGVGLGFGIVGGTSSGVVVKTILPGSIADKDGHLCPGDHILRIRGISVHGMSPQQIASILRRQDTLVELVVGRPVLTFDSSNDTANSLLKLIS